MIEITSPPAVGARFHNASLEAKSDQGPRARLLLVDDDETIRLALSRFLRSRGFSATLAGRGTEAVEKLRQERFDLMICDVRMPGISGLEVVAQARELDPNLAIVMLSAVNDAPTATEAMSGGALDYLMKPVELTDLLDSIERALKLRESAIEQQRLDRLIREQVALRTSELEHEKETLRLVTVGVAEALINAMEAKDLYLRGHSQRVAELAGSIAQWLGLPEETVEAIRLAGRLHDVGKIGIREEILNKPGRLTPQEFEHIKDHVRIGMDILAPLGYLGTVLTYIHDHHEHIDGGGYPRGLAGDAISLGGRILTAADSFDALTSKRAYRDPMTPEQTIAHLATEVGTLLEPRIYEALTGVVRKRNA
jgi:putative nucleotidyltransferase with HDIG domain